MRLYLDDMRRPPVGWLLVKTAHAAIDVLKTVDVEELSLDHDLGEEHTGYDVAKWIVENNVWPARIILHTMNPVGRQNMWQLLQSAAPEGVALEIRVGFGR